jgi:hypothetical protein
MILLNFSHPLTPEQLSQVETLAGQTIERIVDVPVDFDHEQPFPGQVESLVDESGLAPREWETAPLLVNPSAFNFIAVTLLAHLHGRMGYFPTILRLRPVPGSTPPRFEVAELVDLQAVRDAARKRRSDETTN